jgi:hypothetical protein
MESISWIGAFVGAVAAFGLGAIWYSPALFGRQWLAATGLSEEQLAAAPQGRTFAIAGVASLVAALVFAAFLGPAGVGFGTAVGATAGVGWVATSFAINYAFEQKPLSLFLVNAGYHAVQFTLYGFCIGAANSWL